MRIAQNSKHFTVSEMPVPMVALRKAIGLNMGVDDEFGIEPAFAVRLPISFLEFTILNATHLSGNLLKGWSKISNLSEHFAPYGHICRDQTFWV